MNYFSKITTKTFLKIQKILKVFEHFITQIHRLVVEKTAFKRCSEDYYAPDCNNTGLFA